jgi:hypothetical protein
MEVVQSKNVFDAGSAAIPQSYLPSRQALVKASLLDGPFRPLFHEK